MKDYIVLGPPGSGKGTQAKMLANKLGLFYFGTGDLMREEAAKNTPLGKEFQAIWDRGQGRLVSEELVISFVREKLKNLNLTRAIVFDGFPRTIKQAQVLDEFFKQNRRDYEVLNIQVSAGSLIKRMETRRVCPKCDKIFSQPEKQGIKTCDSCGVDLIQREEDKPDIIRKRINVYNTKTEALIDYYQNLGKIINIDGEPSIEEVDREIWKKVNGN